MNQNFLTHSQLMTLATEIEEATGREIDDAVLKVLTRHTERDLSFFRTPERVRARARMYHGWIAEALRRPAAN